MNSRESFWRPGGGRMGDMRRATNVRVPQPAERPSRGPNRIPLPYRALPEQVSRSNPHGADADRRDAVSRAEERRSRLLEAMLEVVGERGYANASVSLLLERTGLYRQAFYDDFLDKEDCFLQAYDHAARQLEGIVSAAAAEADDWRGRLRRGLAAAL